MKETLLQGSSEEAEIQIPPPTLFVYSQGETGVDLMVSASLACCLEPETPGERPRHEVCSALLSDPFSLLWKPPTTSYDNGKRKYFAFYDDEIKMSKVI